MRLQPRLIRLMVSWVIISYLVAPVPRRIEVANDDKAVGKGEEIPGGKFPVGACPEIDPSKRQVLMLVVGTVRSFVYPTVHEYYHLHQVRSIENSSNAQVHQIWYFSLEDSTATGNHPGFPPASMTRLRDLQALYRVPVLETYGVHHPSSVAAPKDFDQHPYRLNCTDNRTHGGISASYVQAHHFQSAFEAAVDYADACDVDWTHVVRTRPDYVCTSPISLNLTRYEAETPGGRYFIQDVSWKWQVADYFYVMDRGAADALLFPTYLDSYFRLPCNAVPRDPSLMGGLNPESLLNGLVRYNGIRLVSATLGMCAIGRRNEIDCRIGKKVRKIKVTCQNVNRYRADALQSY